MFKLKNEFQGSNFLSLLGILQIITNFQIPISKSLKIYIEVCLISLMRVSILILEIEAVKT